jgi:hypothetical protein
MPRHICSFSVISEPSFLKIAEQGIDPLGYILKQHTTKKPPKKVRWEAF